MAEMMKEVVVVEPHKYEVREVEIPELANEDEVLIQMKSAGVCGSDHHIWHGSNPCSTYPRIPGHENAGVIAKIGKNVKNVKVGDHVIVDLLSSCGTCYQCTHGRKNVCEHVKVRGSGADGGWRQYFTAPAKEYTRFLIPSSGKMRHLLSRLQSVPTAQDAVAWSKMMSYLSLVQERSVPLSYRHVRRRAARP